MRRPAFIARQSRCPSGLLGRLIGYIMSGETAAANDAALGLLDLQPTDRVLEVGYGHGRTIERAASVLTGGLVAGIDLSADMARMAEGRCRRFIDEGRVSLMVGDSAELPYPDRFFDKAYTMHTIYFWADPKRHLAELRRVLKEDGLLVLGFHSKDHPAARDFPASVYTFYGAEDARRLLEQAGFERIVAVAPPDAGPILVTARRPSAA